ncbi:MAG TPA: 4Fe-4S cluster-binding domain-containing protein [Spirochaetota bacterium]|nr:4Fe-4S cluster-binding domain-containing protein [Spirochaetota bacterium]
MFEIVERFLTISGEAPIIGEPIYLIRFSHCNLSCSYCDTNYKDEVNETVSTKELHDIIVQNVNNFSDLKVLFTGGEPLFNDRQSEILKLIDSLKFVNFYIETNGTIGIENFNLPNCHFVVDWKAPSSMSDRAFCTDNLKKLRIDKDCIKFVINDSDFDWLKDVIKIIEKVNPFLPMYVSPQSSRVELSEIANFIIKNRLPLKMSLQLHKLIWPKKERGV